MLCGWEGWSGVALATRHRQQWCPYLPAHGLRVGDEPPRHSSTEYRPLYTFLPVGALPQPSRYFLRTPGLPQEPGFCRVAVTSVCSSSLRRRRTVDRAVRAGCARRRAL